MRRAPYVLANEVVVLAYWSSLFGTDVVHPLFKIDLL